MHAAHAALAALGACVILLPAGHVAAQIPREEFARRMEHLVDDSLLARSHVGIVVLDSRTGEIIADVNGNKLFHPASNMKVLTTAAAVAYLPAGTRFETRLYTDGAIDGSTLEGNLYVVGAGDPLLETADLDSIARKLRDIGIERIEGNIVGDVGLYDTLHWGAGWMWDDEPWPEEAFISPLILNGNSIMIRLTPGLAPGDRVAVSVDPPVTTVRIENNGVTVPAGTALLDDPDHLRPAEPFRAFATRQRQGDTFTVSGSMRVGDQEEEFPLSVWNPAEFFLRVFANRLAVAEIEWEGEVGIGPPAGKVLLASASHPLDSVLARINKISDNLAAESLLKTLAVWSGGAPGSGPAGLDVVRSYLLGTGLDSSSMDIYDGSGVSWYNSVTPGVLTGVLLDQYRRKESFGRFLSTLPVSGRDGTLEQRMRAGPAAGRIRAKTGTLTAVSTLSGYAETLWNETLIFSIMISHFPGNVRILRELQDAIMTDIVRIAPAGTGERVREGAR